MFTAFTGASGVTIVALGGLLYPILIKEQYGERFSLGLVTTSGSLGLLFPPSLPLILYAVVAKISVDKLFAAGMIPGFLLLVGLAAYSVMYGKRLHVPRTPFTWKDAIRSLRAAAWELPLPVLIIGGIYSGTFTATEAAAVTAFYVLIVEVFVYKDLKLFPDIPRVMRESMLLVGAILMIIGTAMGLTNYLVDEEVPMKLFEFTKTVHQQSRHVPGGSQSLPDHRRDDDGYLFRDHRRCSAGHPDRARVRRGSRPPGDHLSDQPGDRLPHAAGGTQSLHLESAVREAGVHRCPFDHPVHDHTSDRAA